MPTDNIQYPYDLPAGVASVDFLLADPKRVTRSIARLALQKFMIDRIFSPAGTITGGAVVYEQATENDLYPNRDVEKVEAGDEFPVITFDSGSALTAQVEKFGGKFPVTDEAKRRNQLGRVTRAMNQVANVIVRKTQQRALSELQAAITANSRTASGNSWLDLGNALPNTVAPAGQVIGDLTAVEKANEDLELGYSYDLAIMNSQEWRNLRLAAGGTVANARALLADSGINDVWVTNRKTAGTVYWLSQGNVGELGYEVPLSTETWRDADGKQQDWFQTFVLPIMYVTDPFALLETTGHAA